MATGFPSFDASSGGLELRKTYLIVGSKDSGKEDLVYRLTASALYDKTAVVYVTVNKAPSDLLTEFNARSINISQYLGSTLKFIDDFSRNISPTATDNNYTKVLNGPLDLTGLSVALSVINGDFLKVGTNVVNIFDSLSSLLLYNSPATLFRFLQFICGRAKMSGVTSVFLLDNQMHTQDVNETIKSLTDGVITLKLEEGKRYFTLTGVNREVLRWTPL
jgi:KaiC/GvpD/RAD55 family RecA-like ATPase